MTENLRPLPKEALDWSEAARAASLETLVDRVRGQCQKAIDWYVTAKIPKKRVAAWLRGLIILLTSLAGLLAVLVPILDDPPFVLPPASISIVAALSAAFLGIDRFFGFSRGWIRYVQTELKLRTALNAFHLAWYRRCSRWTGPGSRRRLRRVQRAQASGGAIRLDSSGGGHGMHAHAGLIFDNG